MIVLSNISTWQVYPEEIAKRAGLNYRTVLKHFEKLKQAGYLREIKVSFGRGTGSRIFRFFSDRKISEFSFQIMQERLFDELRSQGFQV